MNEYQEWLNDFDPKQKVIYNICMKYPFLVPRDSNGVEVKDFDYEYLSLEIPEGWYRLFLQMCEDIKPILEKENCLDDFYFVQVKEKYNHLICYSNIRIKEIQDVLSKYEVMAQYVCVNCGMPAVFLSKSYIESFCDKCKDSARSNDFDRLDFKPYFTRTKYKDGILQEDCISFKNEWERYLNEIKRENCN